MGERLALVVATGAYDGSGLARLRSPVHDAARLAQVLADPAIGGFTVTSVVDQPHHKVRLAIEDFLDDRKIDDLILLYLSCHGVKDARGRLFYAAADTLTSRLASTGVESTWLMNQLEDCRARRQVLILDCCYSGAFADRAKATTAPELDDHLFGAGRGSVVLTASRGIEYSFEGEPVPGAAVAGSVFTSGLVEGLRTGAADLDHDGRITVDEAYDYVFDHVRRSGVAQTPQRFIRGGEGRIVLARAPAPSASGPRDRGRAAAPTGSRGFFDLPIEPSRVTALAGGGAAVAAAGLVGGEWIVAVVGVVSGVLGAAIHFREAGRGLLSVCFLACLALTGGGIGMGVMGMVVGSVGWVVAALGLWGLAVALVVRAEDRFP